jgi:murein DD-endopeptidase MepM/ murein hydrolase activator NlpD
MKYYFFAVVFLGFSLAFTTDTKIPELLPIEEGAYESISSKYGMRVHPILKERRFHHGIDFAAKLGTPVRATAEGEVIEVAFKKNTYGYMVRIQHADGVETLYAQLQDYIVEEGQPVREGAIIGHVGNSGMSTAPHLHYEIRINGKTVDPLR